ncbi:DUF2487 family protein [Paenibacillus sp. DMB20]|uniref:DUF2487 family protein n=1 Tax=Paenibacillus sp. DMB20 TaxID=1642570 RepID=UPI0006279645|nr:DUF2487 family protein [Paenibacillus sp. DMB20]KKO51939.1 hypothetical protein XI25_20850 [Paenibacillus sp. DMB20]
MKFSEVDEKTWPELQPYFDTCLIPYTGMTGAETPWEATMALERLRDFLDYVEIPFKGRVVTYPAMQYGGQASVRLLNEICHKVKSTGFAYAIVMTADCKLTGEDVPESALVLSLPEIAASGTESVKEAVAGLIGNLWNKKPGS